MFNHSDSITICLKKGGDKDLAGSMAKKLMVPVGESKGDELTLLFDSSGVSLTGYGLSYQGDFGNMIHRISDGRLSHEMLSRVAKMDEKNAKAIDATAGMGEDSLLLAALGYDVTLFEQNPVIAVLLKDAIRRAKKNPVLKDIVSRMHVIQGDSVNLMPEIVDKINLIYLDPMFPKRQKTGLINKKLQLIQKLEPPCSTQEELFNAAVSIKPDKIVVKRPLKSPFLDDRNPNYMLKGKAIRYDCYVVQ